MISKFFYFFVYFQQHREHSEIIKKTYIILPLEHL